MFNRVKKSPGTKRRTSWPPPPDPRDWWEPGFVGRRAGTPVAPEHLSDDAKAAMVADRAAPTHGHDYAAPLRPIVDSFEAEHELLDFIKWYRMKVAYAEGIELADAAKRIVYLRARYAPEYKEFREAP